MTPMTPKSSNVRRHEIAEISIATSSGVNAPLTRVASQRIACARSRSLTGSQVVEHARQVRERAGLAGAEERAHDDERRRRSTPSRSPR